MAHGSTSTPAWPDTGIAGVRVDSDVGRLLRVLVHRPGSELARVGAGNAAEMLFDGPVSVAAARAEHDELVAALRSAGAEVAYLDALLGESGHGRFGRADGRRRTPALPNLMFTRDPMVVVGDGLHVGRLARPAREPETAVARALSRHPLLAAARRWSDGDLAVEGGDVLLAGDGVVVVGVGPRTTLPAVRALAERLLAAGAAREVLAAVMPEGGPFHLDLAVSMVTRDTVLVDRAVIDRTATVRLLPGREPVAGGRLTGELARALGTSRLREIATAPESHGRPWDRGANVLAVAEGVVVAYADNAATNRRLRAAGIDVLPVPGAQLGKGRGGPRCLTCPLLRLPVVAA